MSKRDWCDYIDTADGRYVSMDEAAAEITRLRERVRELEADGEAYRWGVENARWIRHEHEAYVAIPVAVDANLSCVAFRRAAIDRARGKA